MGKWRTTQRDADDLTESEVRDALEWSEPLWGELFPAEQARTVRLLIGRVEISPTGADIRLRVKGLASLMRDPRPGDVERRRAA
jgi:hypothetical protein